MKSHTRKKLAAGLSALGIMGLLAVTSVSAATQHTQGSHSEVNKSIHQAIHEAIHTNNYEAFKAAVADAPKPPKTPEITPEIFAKLVEADKLREAGDMTGAKKIMVELGFKKMQKPQGEHGHYRKGMTPPDFTADQKKAFGQARALFHAGKFEEAEQILDDAGITPPSR